MEQPLVCELDFLLGKGVFDPGCMGAYVAKALGTVILAGSFALKLPQIMNILTSKNVDGLSPAAFYTEVPVSLCTIIYNVLQNNPFTSYGETCIVCVQNIVLVLLLWAFMKPAPSTLHKLAVSGSLVAFTFLSFTEIQPEFQYLLPLCGVPLLVYSRGAQVWSNFLNGSTGQLSIITSFLQLGGSAARIFTTIQEVGYDIPLLTGYGTSFMLSATLLLQIIFYSYVKKAKKD